MTDAEKLDMAIGYLTGKILVEKNVIKEMGSMILPINKIRREEKIATLTYAVKVLEKARSDE